MISAKSLFLNYMYMCTCIGYHMPTAHVHVSCLYMRNVYTCRHVITSSSPGNRVHVIAVAQQPINHVPCLNCKYLHQLVTTVSLSPSDDSSSLQRDTTEGRKFLVPSIKQLLTRAVMNPRTNDRLFYFATNMNTMKGHTNTTISTRL